jgi:Domain of unknown function (DUF4386)
MVHARGTMTEETIQSQRIAARIAGFTLLALMISGFMGMFISGHLVVDGNADLTVRNILTHERAFRVGLVFEFLMLSCDVLLALALYALLKPVNSTLALLGSFWRIANAIILGVGIAATLVKPDESHAFVLIFLDLSSQLSLIGLMCFCIGAGFHSWLLYRSKYIPRLISGLYLFSCVEMLMCCLAFIIFPNIRTWLDPAFVVPDFIAELSVALWLALKGVRIAAP